MLLTLVALVLPLNLLLADTTDPPAAPTGATWTIDSVHSAALFRVKHSPGVFWGRFNDVSGSATFDGERLEGLSLNVHIAIKSVDTGNENLDKHLRSADFFNEVEFPEMTFTSTGVKARPSGGYTLSGTLTMLGHTAPVEAEMEFLGTIDTRKGARTGLEATFTIKRSAFGMDYGLKSGLGDSTRVIVALEMIKAKAPAQTQ
jgi:polyisoprenoid-binding protein YceI